MEINRKKLLIIAGAVLAALAIVLIIALWTPDTGEKKKGVEYLKQLEAKNIETVEEDVKKVRKEAQAKAMESGELSVWAQFSD